MHNSIAKQVAKVTMSLHGDLWVDKKRGMAKCENQRNKLGIEQ